MTETIIVRAGTRYRTKAEQLWLVEAALWLKWMHVGTAESLTHCELLGLDVGKVQDSSFPGSAHGQTTTSYRTQYYDPRK